MYVFTPEYGVDTQCLSAYKKVKVSADTARPKGILLGSCWNPAMELNLDINRVSRRLDEAVLILKGLHSNSSTEILTSIVGLNIKLISLYKL